MLMLASASPRRLALLEQVGIVPAQVIAADIDESPRKLEIPTDYVKRMAREKCAAIAMQYPDALVLAADTVVACGRRILPKAEDEQTARACLEILQGRRHRVYTAVCISKAQRTKETMVMTHVRFLRLNKKQIDEYIATNEWAGKAGGYAIQGAAQAFIPSITGSFSNVVGLPLSETVAMLRHIQL